MIRTLLTAVAASALIVGVSGAPAAAAPSSDQRPGVEVTGTVAAPARYSAAQIAAEPQVTLPDLRRPHRSGDVTGAELRPLVVAAQPVTPDVKNAQLRVTVVVTGRDHRPVAFALGELDPQIGDHPALLVASACGRHGGGVDLVVPGDHDTRRTVRDVASVRVAVAEPATPADVPAGALRIVSGGRSVTVSAETLAALPTTSRTVSFQSAKGLQTHTETGPSLAAVLRAGHVRVGPATTVAAVADDGYVATVTPAEATSGARPLLLSLTEDDVPLTQPRLVPAGDVYGGRYVSGVLELLVSGPPRH